jgi:hypothetical protein
MSAGMMKRAFFSLILIGMLAVFVELASSYFVYYYYKRIAFCPPESEKQFCIAEVQYRPGRSAAIQAVYVAKRMIDDFSGTSVSSGTRTSGKPNPVFVAHKTWGFSINPGKYEIQFEHWNRRVPFRFFFEVLPNGTRRTSYAPVKSDRNIYIFGDSFPMGWGVNDQQTVGWMLQERYRDWGVQNFAQYAYGNIHALAQVRDLRGEIDGDDIVLLFFGSHLTHRNGGGSDHVQFFNRKNEASRFSADLTYPVPEIRGDKITMSYRHIKCSVNAGWCKEPGPSEEHDIMVTKRILDEIRNLVPAKVVLVFEFGKDDDPVVKHWRETGGLIADIRPDAQFFERDRIDVYDGHPGPYAHFNYFRKLSAFLETNQLAN